MTELRASNSSADTHPEDGRPEITVVIPTYNRADMLPEAIDSALGQSAPPLEVIVVDDGSEDATPELCGRYGPPVRYIRQENAGVSAARNHGVREARGSVVAFLDSDDAWEPGKLEVHGEVLRRWPHVGWSLSDSRLVGSDRRPRSSSGFRDGFSVFRELGRPPADVLSEHLDQHAIAVGGAEHLVFVGDLYELLFHGNCVLPSSLVVRKAVLESVGGFDPEFRLAEETECVHRLAAASPAAVIMTPLVRWRVGDHASLVSPANLERLVENALRSLDRALDLRPDAPSSVRQAYARGRRKQWERLAYLRLSDLRTRDAREVVRAARLRGVGMTRRMRAIELLSYLPVSLLRVLHGVKRRLGR